MQAAPATWPQDAQATHGRIDLPVNARPLQPVTPARRHRRRAKAIDHDPHKDAALRSALERLGHPDAGASEIKQIGLEPDLMHRCVNGCNQYREQLATSLEQIQAMA